MEDLRTRIITALTKEDQLRVCKLSDADIRFMADAVIHELRLSEDRGVVIGCDGKCAVGECGCPNWEADDD